MQKLIKQGYVVPRMDSLLQELYGRHDDLVDRYEIFISQNDNGSFPFYVDCLFPPSPTGVLPDFTVYIYMSSMVDVL
jgi:hypothetical protein